MISNFGTIHLAEFELICEGFIQNSGIFEMSANSTVSANLVHAEGNMVFFFCFVLFCFAVY